MDLKSLFKTMFQPKRWKTGSESGKENNMCIFDCRAVQFINHRRADPVKFFKRDWDAVQCHIYIRNVGYYHIWGLSSKWAHHVVFLQTLNSGIVTITAFSDVIVGDSKEVVMKKLDSMGWPND